jgi:DNA-binding CsgD family transcriptional regulator
MVTIRQMPMMEHHKSPSIEVFQQIWQNQPFQEEVSGVRLLAGRPEEAVKMLTLGSQFLYIHDCRTLRITYCSPGFQQLTGYIHQPSIEFLYEIIHPDDREMVIRSTWLAIDFAVLYKKLRPLLDVFSIDYRLKQANGNYIRVQRQDAIWQKDRHNNILKTISLFTDITEHKKSNDIQYWFNHPAFQEYLLQNKDLLQVATLTQREKQILHLLVKGKNSREIADLLHISMFTVDTHRRNMKQKLKAKSTAKLLLYALEQGLS